jgi:micrococcal nuclease
MKKYIIYLFLIIIFGFTTVLAKDKLEVKFAECVDGDTAKFYIDNNIKTARFLAIDTPETKHPSLGEQPYGKEASNYTCSKLKNAKLIELEYDDKSSKQDKYNRLLVWVWVDNSLLQKDLITKGLAKVDYVYGNYKYVDELKTLELEAKTAKINIWDDYTGPNYTLLTIIIILIIIDCSLSPKFRNYVFKKIKKEYKKKR